MSFKLTIDSFKSSYGWPTPEEFTLGEPEYETHTFIVLHWQHHHEVYRTIIDWLGNPELPFITLPVAQQMLHHAHSVLNSDPELQ